MKKFLFGLIIFFAVILGSYLILLCNPNLILKHNYKYKNFTVHSDKKIPTAIEYVLDDALTRLKTSELYKPNQKFCVSICQNVNLFYFFTRNKTAGGVVNFALSPNAFIRNCDIYNNKITPAGTWLFKAKERPLSYFIAHECTHSMQSKLDRFMIFKNPNYIIEGYADYVGKSKEFNFDKFYNDYLENDNSMQPKNGLYNKYHLYIAFLFDKKGYDFKKLVKEKPNLDRTLDEMIFLDEDLVQSTKM